MRLLLSTLPGASRNGPGGTWVGGGIGGGGGVQPVQALLQGGVLREVLGGVLGKGIG